MGIRRLAGKYLYTTYQYVLCRCRWMGTQVRFSIHYKRRLRFRQTGLLHRFYYFNCRTDYLGYDLTGIRLYIVTVRNHQSCRKSNQDYHPILFLFLIICGIWAIFVTDNAIEGLKYYLLPDFSKFSFTVFSQAATQVLFSVGIGWGIYETLGANIPKKNNLKSDAILVSICDTGAAILAGFVIIPSAFAGGVDMQSGPSLIFLVMTGIFSKLPGGRLIGICFFLAIVFAVISSLFTFFEISIRTFEDNLKMGRIKATLIISLIIGVGNIIVSLGFGVLSGIKLPWLDASGISYLGLYDWLDTFTGYILLPLGCLLVCLFVSKVWGFEEYEKELTNNGKFERITLYDKILTYIVVPVFMVIIILNVFGFIR